MNVKSILDQHRITVLTAVASLCVVFYSYLTYTPLGDELIANVSFLRTLPGDFPQYVVRYSLSFLLLGLVPFVLIKLLGWQGNELGLVFPSVKRKWFIPLFIIIPVVIGIASFTSEELAAYYPHSKTLLMLKDQYGCAPLIAHHILHFFLYYLPWEFFFRGVLVFPFLYAVINGKNTNAKNRSAPENDAGSPATGGAEFPLLLGIACLQTIPSTLLHFGHPLNETLSAIPFGLVAGYLVLRTRSVLPGLVIHGLIGISLDTMIYIR